MDNEKPSLADAVRQRREELGLNQGEVSRRMREELGQDPEKGSSTLSRIETGKSKNPQLKIRRALAHILDWPERWWEDYYKKNRWPPPNTDDDDDSAPESDVEELERRVVEVERLVHEQDRLVREAMIDLMRQRRLLEDQRESDRARSAQVESLTAQVEALSDSRR